MELYIDQHSFRLTAPSEIELTNALSGALLAQLKESFTASGVTLEEWAADPTAALVVQSGAALATWARDLCGKRMIILGSNMPDRDLLRSDSYLLMEAIGMRTGCDLMQWSIPRQRFEVRDWSVPAGFYATNLIFERRNLPSMTQALGPRFKLMTFEDPGFRVAAADLEYWVRWAFPGSTYGPLDCVREVRTEYDYYPKLAEKGLASGISWASDPTRAYVLWLQNRPANKALIAMIWIDPVWRGEINGDELLTVALQQMASAGISGARYFVSAQNIAAIKMLHRAGFQMIQYNLNKALR